MSKSTKKRVESSEPLQLDDDGRYFFNDYELSDCESKVENRSKTLQDLGAAEIQRRSFEALVIEKDAAARKAIQDVEDWFRALCRKRGIDPQKVVEFNADEGYIKVVKEQ